MAIYRDDTDRHRFLELLSRIAAAHGLVCHAYCLMTTHYHLVSTTTTANLSKTMHRLNTSYAQWWNRRHGGVGHVFQGRFGAQVVAQDSYLLTACRYVVLNPVRANLVRAPEDWPWSSYRATAGLMSSSFLRPELLLAQFDSTDRVSAIRRYREFVMTPPNPNNALVDRPVLSDDFYVARFTSVIERACSEVPRRHRRLRARRPLGLLFSARATRATRNSQIVEAHRQGYAMAEIARYLQLHDSTISKIIAAGSDLES